MTSLMELLYSSYGLTEPITFYQGNNMPTQKQLDKMIKQQEEFVKQNQLTLALMRSYQRDKDNVIFLGSKLMKACQFDEKYLDECFGEIAEMAQHGCIGFAPAGGLFRVIEIVTKKKNSASMDDIINFINEMDFKNI